MRWLALVACVGVIPLPLHGCASRERPRTLNGVLGPRADVVVASLTEGDAELLRTRPAMVAGKYQLMATDAFAFFRGSLALYLRDWLEPSSPLRTTRFAADAVAFGLGDPHPENFGTLRTREGLFRLEPNDFDTADVVPYLWDVRRLAVSLCVASHLSNAGDEAAREAARAAVPALVRAAAASYAETLRGLAAGGPRPVVEAGGGNAILEDLFARAASDWGTRADLEVSPDDEAFPRLVRGAPDPADPGLYTRELPARSRMEIAATLAAYRPTLPTPPVGFVPLDAVALHGRGIGSFPRVRAIALTRGPTTEVGDDVLLELKELPAGPLPLPLPTTFATPGARVREALAAGWTERGADPLWGVGTWAGLPVQLRSESPGFKTIRVARFEGALGTPSALEGLGVVLARLVARMHAAPVNGVSPAAAIAASIALDPAGFADEQVEVAVGYCAEVRSDWDLFKRALAILGPTLGPAGPPAPAPTPELGVLFDPKADPRRAGVDPVMGPVLIDELCATGAEYVELLNGSDAPQSLAGHGLADADLDGGPRFGQAVRFLPGTSLPPGGRMLVLQGDVPSAGPQSTCLAGAPLCYQAAWHLSASDGETAFLLTPDDVIADRVTFPERGISSDQSWGRSPDGTGPFRAAAPSPNAPNASR